MVLKILSGSIDTTKGPTNSVKRGYMRLNLATHSHVSGLWPFTKKTIGPRTNFKKIPAVIVTPAGFLTDIGHNTPRCTLYKVRYSNLSKSRIDIVWNAGAGFQITQISYMIVGEA